MSERPALAPAARRSHAANSSLPVAPTSTSPTLSAWQRWEMTSLTEEAPQVSATVAPLKPVLLIDEAELARLRLLAQQAGDSAGHREGFERGLAEGHAAGLAAVQAQAAQLQALAQSLPNALHGAEQQVANDLLALSLDLARQVLGEALKTEPHLMLTVVRELLQAEPALMGMPQLLLHPDDAALVKQHVPDELQAAGWRIRADATLQRGGCRVLANSGERDATLPTRWDRVAAALLRNAGAAAASHAVTDTSHD